MKKYPEQAFPSSCTDSGHAANVDNGMSLRDYFAAKAMQGLLCPDTSVNVDRYEIATKAYKIADAMLKQKESDNAE